MDSPQSLPEEGDGNGQGTASPEVGGASPIPWTDASSREAPSPESEFILNDDDDEDEHDFGNDSLSLIEDVDDHNNRLAPQVHFPEGEISPININHMESSFFELLLFFGCGVGSSLPYIATLSALVFYMMEYGQDSFVYLNLAVYFPLLPISLAQARWDQEMDQIYKSYRTFLFRGVVGFILSVYGTYQVARFGTMSLSTLVYAAILQGTGGAILYGIFNQMASFVEANRSGGSLKASVSAGFQGSAIVVLILSLSTGFGSTDSSKHYKLFFCLVILLELVCMVLFLVLVTCRPVVSASLLRRDSSMLDLRPLLDQSARGDVEGGGDPTPDLGVSRNRPVELSFWDLYKKTRSSFVIILITLVPSFLVGSWFTSVRTHWMQLPQVLFYTRIGSDFLGRLATMACPPKSTGGLACLALLRLFVVAAFFVNASEPETSRKNDIVSIVLVVVIAFLSGYLVTGSFQLAPKALDSVSREVNVTKQASILNVAFALSALGGLFVSFIMVACGL